MQINTSFASDEDIKSEILELIQETTKTGELLYPAHRDFSYVLDLGQVGSSKYVVPGDPDRSELYKLIVEEKMPEGAEFCFDPSCPYPPLTDEDWAIVEAWIRSLE